MFFTMLSCEWLNISPPTFRLSVDCGNLFQFPDMEWSLFVFSSYIGRIHGDSIKVWHVTWFNMWHVYKCNKQSSVNICASKLDTTFWQQQLNFNSNFLSNFLATFGISQQFTSTFWMGVLDRKNSFSFSWEKLHVSASRHMVAWKLMSAATELGGFIKEQDWVSSNNF